MCMCDFVFVLSGLPVRGKFCLLWARLLPVSRQQSRGGLEDAKPLTMR